MKKIFIVTGEPSGDRLASKVILTLKKKDPSIEFLSVGGENLRSIGVPTIYDLSEITYLGFTKVLLNIFKINKKINETVNKVIQFNPDILLTVDSPDFTLRVAERVKKLNSKIKTVHYVAPQVWIWRKGRVKKIKKFIDHILILFSFEKVFFEKENINCVFVGHSLLDKIAENKIDINHVIEKNKAIISIFPGSRLSEIKSLMPILLGFVKLMNNHQKDMIFIFHSINKNVQLIKEFISKSSINNCEVISEETIKSEILKKSIFAIVKSGTISLEVANAKIPSIVIYKMNFLNFLLIKLLINIKYANIFNIVSNREVIPELLQSKCNAKNIYKTVNDYLNTPSKMKEQINSLQEILKTFKTEKPSVELASNFLNSLIK